MPGKIVVLQKKTDKYHPDIAFFLAAIPVIAAINYFLTYTNIRLNGFLALTFTIDTLQGYLAWWAVRSEIVWLDKKLPYHSGVVRRMVVQTCITLITGLMIIALATEMVSLIAKGETAPINFYTLDMVIIAIWFLVINGVYIMLHYYHAWRLLTLERNTNNAWPDAQLLVKQGKTDYRLAFDEVAGFFVEGDYVIVTTNAGQKYFLDQSLDKLESGLPTDLFFRLNRQYIVHQRMVLAFRRADNGKLEILLQPHTILPASITVSRSKAPSFKSWFRPSG